MTSDQQRLDRATAGLEPPFAAVDLDAFDGNAADLLRRAGPTPVRLASKSVRCRALIERALAAGLRGILAFTLPEALWLAQRGFDDLVVAYPSVDRAALRALATGPRDRVTVMVDCVEHLDLVAAIARDAGSGPVRVCLDLDAGWWPLRGRIRIGARRSPVRTPEQAVALAREALRRPELVLDGLMSYEAHIAGLGDRPPGQPLLGAAIRLMQRASARELAVRRAAVVAAVRELAPLRLVNGGGTGSVERTAAESAVTEVSAGSGLYGPTLFDSYAAFSPRPAAFFALPVVRRPDLRTATALGGGYPASGAAGADRLPRPVLPGGLRLDRVEGAGEVQTPLRGAPAADLRIGDRVWFRHAKAGELCERFDRLHLIAGEAMVDVVPTYRGEGGCFL
ncbi:MAG TPA: amino acid deaminase/aldolase [Solirubrobacteraceae bacterium]|nr:amino acid deaminase/aldolase [Solirubrobacteraceae bacterium]